MKLVACSSSDTQVPVIYHEEEVGFKFNRIWEKGSTLIEQKSSKTKINEDKIL